MASRLKVAEYESKPLAFKEAVVKQLSKDVAAAGATDLDIISFNVKAEGDKGALNLKGITLDLKASKKSISKITVAGQSRNRRSYKHCQGSCYRNRIWCEQYT